MSKESHQSHSSASGPTEHFVTRPTRMEMAARLGAGLLVAALAVGAYTRVNDEPSEPFSVVDVSGINEWVTGPSMPYTSK